MDLFDHGIEHPFIAYNWNSIFTRYEFNLTTGKSNVLKCATNKSTEFPVVNNDYMGRKTKYIYLATDFDKLPET